MHDDDDRLRPVDPTTRAPLPPRAQPGYYPGYSTLSQQAFWDEATRRVVLARVEQVPPVRFFTPDEARTMELVCERLLPQHDRDEAHRIPILPFIDERLHEGRGDGYRYEPMPPDREAYRLGLRGIDDLARHRFGRRFADATFEQQEEVLATLHDGNPPGELDAWRRMPAHRFFLLVLQDVVEVYYAHPWAWDEIGFGGPAYPRGYMRLEAGLPEPWEVEEQRYRWAPPPLTITHRYELVGGTAEHSATPGQGGTH